MLHIGTNYRRRAFRTQRDVAAAAIGELVHLLCDHVGRVDRKSTRLNSSHLGISYAVCCFKVHGYNRDLPSFPTRRSSDLRAFRTQRDVAAAAIGELVHLLCDHVGRVSRASAEYLRVIEARAHDKAETD